MKKARTAEAAIIATACLIAVFLGKQLADHHVSTAAITTSVISVITVGCYLASQIAQGLSTRLYTCPTKGCTVSIRINGTTQAELTRLQALATDHTKHGSTR